MTESIAGWRLRVLAVHSANWDPDAVLEFRTSVSQLLADVQAKMQAEHPSLHLEPCYFSGARWGEAEFKFRAAFALAILDVSEYDEDMADLAGFVRGAGIPCVFISRVETEMVGRRASLSGTRLILYQSPLEFVQSNSLLHREASQAISQARVVQQMVYELWFPPDTSTIWVVCPQIHEPGEFADRSSLDFTYLDNLGDTDALLEIMVFLSRYYPSAAIEKFSSLDLPSSHIRGNLVVIGGPGSSDGISNRICEEFMKSVNSRVSYTEDCDRMFVATDGASRSEFKAELCDDESDTPHASGFKVRRDCGYFARFPNPLNQGATVVLANGIHTAGVLGAARAFGDRVEALGNYDVIVMAGASPLCFECHFEVNVVHGDVAVPRILSDNVYSLGAKAKELHRTPVSEDQRPSVDNRMQMALLFVAGDRGGAQRSQIQIPREWDAIQEALQRSRHREAFRLAPPILAATQPKFVEAYRQRPNILHFAGHGDERSLSFILDQGLLVSQTPVIAERLAAIIRSFPDRVRLCVLNTCESGLLAKHLVEEHVADAAIGWPSKVSDATAIAFSKLFYGALGDGLGLERCVRLAAESCGGEEALLYTNSGVDRDSVLVS